MILTVTLNAAVDKTYTIPNFSLDHVHRPVETLTTAGGKGINVARVYHTLGGPVIATGFLGGRNGEYISRSLTTEGISARFVSLSSESRLCIAVNDPNCGTQTEVNENGPFVTSDDCAALFALLRELLPNCRFVVISGSVPPGTPPFFYRDLVLLAQNDFGVPVVLDASGECLVLGITVNPFIVKPNQYELIALNIGGDGWGQSAQSLRAKYEVPLALITAGARGAVVASRDGIWEATPPVVNVLSAVGSGDALTATFVWVLEEGGTVEEALRYGVAAGAANAVVPGAGFCSKADILELASQTRLTRIN